MVCILVRVLGLDAIFGQQEASDWPCKESERKVNGEWMDGEDDIWAMQTVDDVRTENAEECWPE